MLELAVAAASLAGKALGLGVLAFFIASLLPWLRDVWLTRHIPPFVPAPPFLGDLPALSKGMHVLFAERAEKFKNYPAFRVFVGSHVWVVTADPESSRRLMSRLLNRFPFQQIGRQEAFGGGRDLVSLRGERWRRMRLKWLPTFAPPSLALYAPLMDSCARRLCARLDPYAETGEECEVWRMVGELTLDVVGTTAFGVRFNALGAGGGGVDEKDDGGDGQQQQQPQAEPGCPDGQRLIQAARTIFATGSLTSGSVYQGLMVMLPLGAPLWRALAALFPDAKLRELNEARAVLYEAGVALVRRQRRLEHEAQAREREGAEEEREKAAAAGNKAAAAAAASGKGAEEEDDKDGARDQEQQQQQQHNKAASPVPSAISRGILPGSFLAQILKPHEAPAGREHGAAGGGDALPPLEDADAISAATLFTVAGYETTASTLACCLYSLSTSPAAQRRLHAEVDAFFAQEGRGAALTPEAVAARFPYAEACIKEALRLYPPATAVSREVAPPPGGGDPHAFRSDLLQPLAGGELPSLRPGITVAAANFVYQRSPEHWPRADEFLPERWVPEAGGGAASVLGPSTPAAWSPFGGGPRQCIGIKFAMLEAVIALVRLFERFDFERGPSQKMPLPMRQALTLSPAEGVHVVVRRRAGGGGGAGAGADGPGAAAVAA